MGLRQTNISHLDGLLGGGLRHNTITLLMAYPGIDGSAFAYHIVAESLKEGDSCVYLTNSKSGATVVKEMAAFGRTVEDHRKSGLLTFVDSYSTLINEAPSSRFFVESPRDVESITGALKEALEDAGDGHKLVVYDSVSTLVDQCGVEAVNSFGKWKRLFRKNNATGLFLFTQWPYEYGVIEAVKELSDAVVELKAIEEKVIIKEYLQVSKVGWLKDVDAQTGIPFTVSAPGGITMLKPSDK